MTILFSSNLWPSALCSFSLLDGLVVTGMLYLPVASCLCCGRVVFDHFLFFLRCTLPQALIAEVACTCGAMSQWGMSSQVILGPLYMMFIIS